MTEYRIPADTYDAICRALEAAQQYANRRMPITKYDPELIRVQMLSSDALELLDRDEAAA